MGKYGKTAITVQIKEDRKKQNKYLSETQHSNGYQR
jgi:hypothetical protein